MYVNSTNVSARGWMEKLVFLNCFTSSFVPYVTKLREGKHLPNQEVTLIFYGHSSHINLKLVKEGVANKIILIKLPSHPKIMPHKAGFKSNDDCFCRRKIILNMTILNNSLMITYLIIINNKLMIITYMTILQSESNRHWPMTQTLLMIKMEPKDCIHLQWGFTISKIPFAVVFQNHNKEAVSPFKIGIIIKMHHNEIGFINN